MRIDQESRHFFFIQKKSYNLSNEAGVKINVPNEKNK